MKTVPVGSSTEDDEVPMGSSTEDDDSGTDDDDGLLLSASELAAAEQKRSAHSKSLATAHTSLDSLMASLPREERAALAQHAASYLDEEDGVPRDAGLLWTCLYRVRALAILMIFQSCSGFILESYSHFIETHVFLTLYLTMLVGAGGNAGNQSAVNVIRGLATGELSRDEAGAVLWRETRAGVIEGVLLTSVGFWRVYLFQHELRSSIAVSLSLFAITSISVVIGAFLPLAFDRCGMDPAHAGPAIQVVMDVTVRLLAPLNCLRHLPCTAKK